MRKNSFSAQCDVSNGRENNRSDALVLVLRPIVQQTSEQSSWLADFSDKKRNVEKRGT